MSNAMERAPDLRRLRALAAAMGEPVENLARLAAAQWLGVEVTEVPVDSDEWLAVRVPPGLDEQGRERLRRMAVDLARHMET
ncbi:hypothetical protein DQ384_36350 [Sphaerisporangium album]|uniref:Uncharacterized protein n=1 Tax=Sphaerisporangium album TaxID=509200 RepID=A0A367EUY5_9ACTN|nr:hypothetical protein [Sphaerisporangium album]RCG21934.1 hypothetical protein DQ384_36350 [Sphaerisporangium album]